MRLIWGDGVGLVIFILIGLVVASALTRNAGRILSMALWIGLGWWLWKHGINVWDVLAELWEKVQPILHRLIR